MSLLFLVVGTFSRDVVPMLYNTEYNSSEEEFLSEFYFDDVGSSRQRVLTVRIVPPPFLEGDTGDVVRMMYNFKKQPHSALLRVCFFDVLNIANLSSYTFPSFFEISNFKFGSKIWSGFFSENCTIRCCK